jgi:FkbM family methyltransferase
MIDTSQWGEQQIILDFFGDVKGRFLDMGAFDGITGSNTFALAELGWGGVCIEANPHMMAKLLAAHANHPNVECMCAAVSTNNEIISFRGTDNQCGTAIAPPIDLGRPYKVCAVSPKTIYDYFGGFDFISIDLEGLDLVVIQALSALRYHAKLICFEDDIPATRNPDYKRQILETLAIYGFDKVIGTTSTESRSANTLVAKSA